MGAGGSGRGAGGSVARSGLWPLVLVRSYAFLWLVIPGLRLLRLHGYGVDVPATSLEQHERDIHALCSSPDVVGGLYHWSQKLP